MTNLKKKNAGGSSSLQERHGGSSCHTEVASAAAQLWALGALAGPGGLSTLELLVESPSSCPPPGPDGERFCESCVGD